MQSLETHLDEAIDKDSNDNTAESHIKHKLQNQTPSLYTRENITEYMQNNIEPNQFDMNFNPHS